MAFTGSTTMLPKDTDIITNERWTMTGKEYKERLEQMEKCVASFTVTAGTSIDE